MGVVNKANTYCQKYKERTLNVNASYPSTEPNLSFLLPLVLFIRHLLHIVSLLIL